LVAAHEKYAGGATQNLWVDDVFYAMERTGFDKQPGLVFALKNSGRTLTRWLRTQFHRQLRSVAWGERSAGVATKLVAVNPDGSARVRVDPRSYVVLAPT
jgi:hypothetical protein